MEKQRSKVALKEQDTYVYIDVSNIRLACRKTLGENIDFVKLLSYFKRKYINLKDVRYYEGIAKGDEKKRRMFDFLEQKGYTVCDLERKSYNSVDVEETNMECPQCGHKWVARLVKEHKAMKSNVDVYLAADLVAQASSVAQPTRLILVSCDGDYAEAIRLAIDLNDNVSVSVLATPYVRDLRKNTCSVRLRKLCNEIEMSRYMVQDIRNILPSVTSNKNGNVSCEMR